MLHQTKVINQKKDKIGFQRDLINDRGRLGATPRMGQSAGKANTGKLVLAEKCPERFTQPWASTTHTWVCVQRKLIKTEAVISDEKVYTTSNKQYFLSSIVNIYL